MIADCVRSHVAWISLQAVACGGATGTAGAIDWAWVPPSRTLHLLFPDKPGEGDVESALAIADGVGATATALWSARDRRLPQLRDLGFTAGWQPWWMQADPTRVRAEVPRVRLATAVPPQDAGLAPLLGRPDALLAEAVVDGRFAGRAWLHLDGEIAGLYDMEVLPAFQRRGLGRELVGLLAAEAAARGARRLTLNATPVGAVLYASCGFRMLGAGRTWWRHRVG